MSNSIGNLVCVELCIIVLLEKICNVHYIGFEKICNFKYKSSKKIDLINLFRAEMSQYIRILIIITKNTV